MEIWSIISNCKLKTSKNNVNVICRINTELLSAYLILKVVE